MPLSRQNLAGGLRLADGVRPDFVFEHVNVVPMDREHILFGRSVLIKNGRVLDIVDGDRYTAPAGVPSVDGQNREFLMPGLADMHVHVYFEDDFTLYLANGVTTIRNMNGKPAHLEWRARLNAGALLGPRMFTAGPIINGPKGSHPTKISTYPEGVAAVEAQKKSGYDFIKVYDQLPAEAYRGVMDAAKRLRMPVAGHIPDEVTFAGVLKSGQVCIEHAEQIAYHTTPRDYDLSRCGEYARQVKRAGVTVCPTVGTIHHLYWLAVAPERIWNREIMKYAHPEVVAFWKGLKRDTYTENDVLIGWQRRMVRALIDADANVISGTDTFLFGFLPGFGLHEELGFLRDCGLSNFEVLRTSTANAGAYLKMPLGRIERGSLADVILIKKNPLDDLENLKLRSGAMCRGQWYSQETLQTKADALAAGYARRG